MKVEKIQAAVNLPETIKTEKNIPAIKKGDTIKAEVLVLNGENITIKTSEGKIFGARVISGLPLNEGDSIELFVADKSANGLVLKIVSAEPDKHAAFSRETIGKSLTETYGNRVFEVLGFFSRMDIKPERECLNTVFNILEQNPSLDLKAAVFLSANRLAASQENIRVVNAVVKGEMSTGGQLAAIINEIAGKKQNAPETAAKKEEIPKKPPAVQETGGKTPEAEMVKEEKNSTKAARTEAAADIKKDIVNKALSAFINIEEASPEKIKNSALNTLKSIIALKEMIKDADIKGKAYPAEKTDQAYSLMKFISEIDRFYCLHIPFYRNGSLLPAELYVYKRRKKGGMVDAGNTVLLFGLDTANIGRVEAVMRIEKRNVTLVFRLNHHEAGDAIKQKAVALHKGFRELGYNLAETQITRLEKRTTAVDAEEELISAAYKTPVYLDYRV